MKLTPSGTCKTYNGEGAACVRAKQAESESSAVRNNRNSMMNLNVMIDRESTWNSSPC
jgi:hypothetical protein